MKITGFRPLIMSNDAERVRAHLEALGFAKTHEKKDVTETHDGGFRMKNADGYDIAVAQVGHMPQDMMAVQMNVDDFDEAYELLSARGFKNMRGDGDVIETGSSRTAMLVSPYGLWVNIVHHVK